jgi:hypothetical protein
MAGVPSAAEAAEITFEPWPPDAEPPSPNETLAHLMVVRMAHLVMLKSKEELVEMASQLSDDKAGKIWDTLLATKEFFGAIEEMVQAALVRVGLAGAVVTARAESVNLE